MASPYPTSRLYPSLVVNSFTGEVTTLAMDNVVHDAVRQACQRTLHVKTMPCQDWGTSPVNPRYLSQTGSLNHRFLVLDK